MQTMADHVSSSHKRIGIILLILSQPAGSYSLQAPISDGALHERTEGLEVIQFRLDAENISHKEREREKKTSATYRNTL